MATAIELEGYQYISHRHCNNFNAYVQHDTFTLVPTGLHEKSLTDTQGRLRLPPRYPPVPEIQRRHFPRLFITFRLFFYHGFAIILSHTKPHWVGLLWTSDQLVAETSTWQHTTLATDNLPCHRRDSNPQSQQARGSSPTP
jgi:hypothetical protein